MDFKSLMRPTSPNAYLVCPEDFCPSAPHRVAKVYAMSFQVLSAQLALIMNSLPRTTLQHSNQVDEFHYIQRSRLLRFPDDIYIKLIALDNNTCTLAIYSQARYGYYDFGVNRRRVIHILRQLE